jgi:hypothetical protein
MVINPTVATMGSTRKGDIMTSDLKADWPWIVQHFRKSILSSQFYSFATVNPDGSAHVTPIASLVLKDDGSGYFSDVFPGSMAKNLKVDQRICIMAVRMGFWYWLKALVRAVLTAGL